MFSAFAKRKDDGSRLLVVGLSNDDVARMLMQRPILFDVGQGVKAGFPDIILCLAADAGDHTIVPMHSDKPTLAIMLDQEGLRAPIESRKPFTIEHLPELEMTLCVFRSNTDQEIANIHKQFIGPTTVVKDPMGHFKFDQN